LARAYYSHRIGPDIELCEVVAVVDQNAHVTVLRKLPLKKTDIDVPKVTDWTPLDLADTRGDGQVDVILVGDAYEDHWIEVISVQQWLRQDIFFWPWLVPVGLRLRDRPKLDIFKSRLAGTDNRKPARYPASITSPHRE